MKDEGSQQIRIEVGKTTSVSALLTKPSSAKACYVFAHGAGAGMTHTFVDDVLEIVPHRARGYQKVDGQLKNATLMDSSYKIPGGGYVTSAEDLVRFGQALLDDKLLKAGTRGQMWTATKVSGPSAYGLGFSLPDDGRFVTHTGGQSGTTTRLFIIPQAHFVLALMANMDGVQLTEVARALVQQMQLPFPADQH